MSTAPSVGMREVELKYRVHYTFLSNGQQRYALQGSKWLSEEQRETGLLFDTREAAEQWAKDTRLPGILVDIEEYETNPKENDNA